MFSAALDWSQSGDSSLVTKTRGATETVLECEGKLSGPLDRAMEITALGNFEA